MTENRVRCRASQQASLWTVLTIGLLGCDSASPGVVVASAQEPISRTEFAGLVERVSERGGYFDTDNLISNETGYLNVLDALAATGLAGGGYVGVGPDQNFSYIAELRPAVAFIVDVRRDNLLHHLLLKALIERSPTRVDFLSALHAAPPPVDARTWVTRDAEAVVEWVDSVWNPPGVDPLAGQSAGRDFEALHDSVAAEIVAFGVPLSEDDLETIRRFHRTFASEGLSLRFTSFGRAPRPYYPTYRQLMLETDADGDRVSYLASSERYAVVRALQMENRVVPVVGDLAGADAVEGIGEVMREMGVRLHAFYASNVEFYLWRAGTFPRWLDNVGSLPVADDAVVIRSYFSNFGRNHPSAVRGYYATQTLQPVASLLRGDFQSYWDVVTRDALPLR